MALPLWRSTRVGGEWKYGFPRSPSHTSPSDRGIEAVFRLSNCPSPVSTPKGLDVNISPQRFNPRSVACLVYQKVFRCTEVRPAAIMSNEVTDFLRSVKELQERREEEDEARSRELEEKFLQEKRERQARRAGRSTHVLHCHCIAFPSKSLPLFYFSARRPFLARAC